MFRRIILFVIAAGMFCRAHTQDARALYEEGLRLKGDKKISEAIQKFKSAVKLNPGLTEARYEWAWCQNDQKNYAGAIENLLQVLQTWNNIPKAYFELGYAYRKQSMPDSSRAAFLRCLELKPDYSGAIRELGYIEYDKDNYTSALDYFDKFIKASKNEIRDNLFWYRKGYSENHQKFYSLAKTSLLNSLKYDSGYINTWLELGFSSSKQKQDDEAISYFIKAMNIDPKNHIPYNGIAEVYRDNKKDMNKAMEWYQKTLALNANERKANFGMGYCLNNRQKYSDAIAYLKRAIENQSDYTAAYVELGYSQYKTGKNSEALENFSKAMQINPQNENARYYATLLYISQKDKYHAQKMVDELRDISSKYTSELQAKVNAMY